MGEPGPVEQLPLIADDTGRDRDPSLRVASCEPLDLCHDLCAEPGVEHLVEPVKDHQGGTPSIEVRLEQLPGEPDVQGGVQMVDQVQEGHGAPVTPSGVSVRAQFHQHR
jgi:hypothetical protein